MTFAIRFRMSAAILTLLGTFLLLGYQNCAPGFMTEANETDSSSTSEFRAKTVAELQQSCLIQGEDVEPTTIRPLSSTEYTDSIKTIFSAAYLDGLRPALDPLFKTLPREGAFESITLYLRYRDAYTQMTDERLLIYHQVASILSNYIAASTNAYDTKRIFDACYSGPSTVTEPCLEKMISNFSLRVTRRPISSEQLAALKTMTAGKPVLEGLSQILYYQLMSPEFLYHLEIEGGLDSGLLSLDQYAIASRLSFQLVGLPPDSELLKRASAGTLSNRTEISSAIDYLRTTYGGVRKQIRNRMWTFVSQWLKLESTVFLSTARMRALTDGKFDVSAERQVLRSNMNEEVREMFEAYIFDQPGSYRDLFTNQKSFSKNSLVASLSGADVWNGTVPNPIFPENQRAGFITTPAFLTTGGESTNPFGVGGTIYKHVLCREFGDTPLPEIQPALHDVDPSNLQTTRERFDSLVPKVGACMSCHSYIDGYGYPLQAYDVFGRIRNGQERIYGADGAYLGSRSIDTSHTAIIDKRTVHIKDTVELVNRLAETTEPQACFARQYIRFIKARLDTRKDACLTARFAKNLRDKSIWEAMKEMFMDDLNYKRRIN